MLHCQYSFGTIVGAPVIFFLGGFVFALLSSLEELGDEDIAEALAFGQWYMIIPHIVSPYIYASPFLSLVSNNSSTADTPAVNHLWTLASGE
jgi:hypothetical protein